jgi:endoglucanase
LYLWKSINDFHEDDRTDYIANEVAVDYNAGFQGTLVAILSFLGTKQTSTTMKPSTASGRNPHNIFKIFS